MNSPAPQLSLVLVGYNCRDLLVVLLDWCFAAAVSTGLALEAVVVDNASRDDTVSVLGARFNDLKIIANSRNVGFATAVNQGVAASSSDAIWILNPDAVPDDPVALAQAVRLTTDHAIFGTRIVSGTGALYRSARAFPSLWWQFCHALGLWSLPGARRFDHCRLPGLDYSRRQRVDWVSGASIVCSRAVFQKLGGFDSDFFLFAEEVDLCRRAAQSGIPVYYDPSITVCHDEGGTRRELADFSWLQSKWGLYQYFRKHDGVLIAHLYAAAAFLETMVRALYYVVRRRRTPLAALRLIASTALMLWRRQGPVPPGGARG